MLRRFAILMAVSGPLAVMMAGGVRAGDDEGFTPLFNGKDLSGWTEPEDKSLFVVEDGEIVGRTHGELKINQFLIAEQPYADFHVKAKVKLIEGNSGIQFRSKALEGGAVSGPQADVAADYWGLLYEERGRGILERYPPEKVAEIVNANGWNEFDIIARGKHVEIFLNGTQIIDRTDEEFDDSGIIALQVHVGPPMEVRFKDITLKTLD